jgi:hypothetical protein
MAETHAQSQSSIHGSSTENDPELEQVFFHSPVGPKPVRRLDELQYKGVVSKVNYTSCQFCSKTWGRGNIDTYQIHN